MQVAIFADGNQESLQVLEHFTLKDAGMKPAELKFEVPVGRDVSLAGSKWTFGLAGGPTTPVGGVTGSGQTVSRGEKPIVKTGDEPLLLLHWHGKELPTWTPPKPGKRSGGPVGTAALSRSARLHYVTEGSLPVGSLYQMHAPTAAAKGATLQADFERQPAILAALLGRLTNNHMRTIVCGADSCLM